MSSEALPLWNIEIRRDEESGPAFYRVHIRDADADPELSKVRHVTDLASLRAMLASLRDAKISAKVMFGGTDAVDAQKAVDLLTDETGTRVVATLRASRADLLLSLGLLRVD